MEKKNLKNLSPEMANILSNFEGQGPTEVSYTVKPLNSGHLRVLTKVSAIRSCPLYRGSFK